MAVLDKVGTSIMDTSKDGPFTPSKANSVLKAEPPRGAAPASSSKSSSPRVMDTNSGSQMAGPGMKSEQLAPLKMK